MRLTPHALYSPEPARGWLPWGWLAPVLAFLFVVAPVTAASVLLGRAGLMDRGGPVGVPGMLAFLMSAFPLLAFMCWCWLRGVERRGLATIGLVGHGRWRSFATGHAIGVASVLSVVALVGLLGGYRVDGPSLAAFASPAALLGMLALLAGFAVQSSIEEIVFRGWLLSAIARKLNLRWAVALTSVVFALLHYGPGQPWLAPLGTLMFSVFTSCWAIRVNHVWGVMGWHSGWNWLLSTGFALPLSGTHPIEPPLLVRLVDAGPALLTGGRYGPEASALCVVLLVIASVLLVGWPRTQQNGASTGT